MIERIQSRRNALAAQMAQAQQQYDQLEASLHTLDRQLCMMAGGLQELDALAGEAEGWSRLAHIRQHAHHLQRLYYRVVYLLIGGDGKRSAVRAREIVNRIEQAE